MNHCEGIVRCIAERMRNSTISDSDCPERTLDVVFEAHSLLSFDVGIHRGCKWRTPSTSNPSRASRNIVSGRSSSLSIYDMKAPRTMGLSITRLGRIVDNASVEIGASVSLSVRKRHAAKWRRLEVKVVDARRMPKALSPSTGTAEARFLIHTVTTACRICSGEVQTWTYA
ncbi:hypothetical protein DENSPDRAFT_173246 [Dentipellis sp. KUC8613]|nr:hypothetical protein DENSPDRAFT_173246 [Dentipellis sp. KUC8613]